MSLPPGKHVLAPVRVENNPDTGCVRFVMANASGEEISHLIRPREGRVLSSVNYSGQEMALAATFAADDRVYPRDEWDYDDVGDLVPAREHRREAHRRSAARARARRGRR